MKNFNNPRIHLVVWIDPENMSYQSCILNTPIIKACEIVTQKMAHFFLRQQALKSQPGEELVPMGEEIHEFLKLVEKGDYDEAYAHFTRESAKTALKTCGVYLLTTGVFKKQFITIQKGRPS